MSKPTVLPEWNNTEDKVLEPDASQKSTGWIWLGTKFQKPKGEVFNWWMNNVYKWLLYIDTEARRLWQKQATTITPTSDADYTLTATENLFGRLILVDGSWTSAHNIIVDVTERDFLVDNSAGTYIATVKTSAGTGIAVEAGAKVWLLCDGTDVIESVDAAGIEIASSAEIRTGTNNTKAVTPLGINETQLGWGQTWQDVSASRAGSVTYTNTTGRPIMVVFCDSASGSYHTVTVDGVDNNGLSSTTIMVPNNGTYNINLAGGIRTWLELR